MPNSLPILEAARAGFIHLRENFRASLLPAAITAAAGALLSMLIWQSPGLALVLTIATGAISIPYVAGQYRRALGLGPIGLQLGADELRLLGAMLAINFFYLIVLVIGGFLAIIFSTIGLISVGVNVQSAPQEPQAMLEALGPRGLIVLAVCMTPLIGAMIWIGARLICYGPATVAHRQIMVFSTWDWTKDCALRIVLAIMALVLPLALGVGLAQGLAGALLLGPGANPAELAASQPLAVLAAQFINDFAALVLLAGPLAGQAAFLYRGLCPLEREEAG